MSLEQRYSRQILFSPIGKDGQEQISKKHVLIIGAGALGAGNAEILARAGVGKLTLVDRDYVDFTNLGRQQLYTEEDAMKSIPKAKAAEQRLRTINSNIEVNGIIMDFQVNHASELLKDVDVILDATDNFDTRMLINDLSLKHRIPWIYGACVGSYGTSFTILPGESPCLHCLLPVIPTGGPTCDTAGIVAPVVQTVVAQQSMEALKLLVGNKTALRRKLFVFDLWNNQYQSVDVQSTKNNSCPSCGAAPTYPYLSAANRTKAVVLCGRDTVQITPAQKQNIRLDEMYQLFSKHPGTLMVNPYLMTYTEEEKRMVLFSDGRVLIHGTSDVAEAKSWYHRYFG